jgi:hypothetical protein
MSLSSQPPASTAIILSFPKRRGRPKRPTIGRDLGTPELIQKRHMGETMEALDLCLERQLITSRQHWCGIHLRWLYTLRHGAPSVRAIDPTHIGGYDIKIDDPLWRTAREMEYHEAINLLAQRGYAMILMNLCIYNERPVFLKAPKTLDSRKKTTSLFPIIDGLDLLDDHWQRTLRATHNPE